MVPIAVQKEQNGYVLNTWFVPLIAAAQTLVTNGVSTPEDVDRTYLKVNAGAGMGPFALIDMVGMKTFFDVLS
ncbi:3-hydroxyacyl-CoA dehydrogenase family protein [Pseudacidovorax sp. RU35E]|uniref:3-hydroxyacyl-CoA dehydrogenase family protein n=1 Tax=Pseudacidovorax sp. RU35E TaxID=1907403 RepID=UPI001F26E66F|nr:3-hydroxyacyl-CoA dehydrogenase family protein [Pseudacidovorax sp. RU35E]